jgi:hypothetical protein
MSYNNNFIKYRRHKLLDHIDMFLDDYHLPEDDNHHRHRRGNLKSYDMFLLCKGTVVAVISNELTTITILYDHTLASS